MNIPTQSRSLQLGGGQLPCCPLEGGSEARSGPALSQWQAGWSAAESGSADRPRGRLVEGGRLLHAAGVCWELKQKLKKSDERRSATFPNKEYKTEQNAPLWDLDVGGGFAGRDISRY